MADLAFTLSALGRAIRAARAEQEKSQVELAVDSGLHRTYLSGAERGTRRISVTALAQIAAGLDMQPSELLARAERLSEERR